MPSQAPNLLNDDGSASIATALMMSHHSFRRDVAMFAAALRQIARGDHARVAAIQEEWKKLHASLHGHHQSEDNGLFPHIKGEHPEAAAVIERLSADHRRIDPLLAAGDAAFAELPATDAAIGVVSELAALLDAHLTTEEAEVVPFMRDMKAFPPPATDAEADMYAGGFAWACHGVAQEVLDRLFEMLPPSLTARLPAARAAFAARWRDAWGDSAPEGASRTPVPDWLPKA
jgi:hypothetical protein